MMVRFYGVDLGGTESHRKALSAMEPRGLSMLNVWRYTANYDERKQDVNLEGAIRS